MKEFNEFDWIGTLEARKDDLLQELMQVDTMIDALNKLRKNLKWNNNVTDANNGMKKMKYVFSKEIVKKIFIDVYFAWKIKWRKADENSTTK